MIFMLKNCFTVQRVVLCYQNYPNYEPWAGSRGESVVRCYSEKTGQRPLIRKQLKIAYYPNHQSYVQSI